MAARPISTFIFQALKFGCAMKHAGVDIIVQLKLYRKTTTSSAGYSLTTFACHIIQIQKLYIYIYIVRKCTQRNISGSSTVKESIRNLDHSFKIRWFKF